MGKESHIGENHTTINRIQRLIIDDQPAQLQALMEEIRQEGSIPTKITVQLIIQLFEMSEGRYSIECYEVLLRYLDLWPSSFRDCLYIATLNGYTDRVRLLLKYGSEESLNSAHDCILQGIFDCRRRLTNEIYQAIELLLDYQVIKVDQPNIYGQTPLMHAIMFTDLRCVRMFLERGPRLDIQYDHQDALGLARRQLARGFSGQVLHDYEEIVSLVEEKTLKWKWRQTFHEVKRDLRLRGLVDDLVRIIGEYL